MKQTAKYAGGLKVAREIGLSRPVTNQEQLYADLGQHGWQWDSRQELWINVSDVPADPPTDLIRVRVWADLEIVEDVAGDVAAQLGKRLPLALTETSKVYPCRPPKQLEGRVYLTFAKRN